MNYLKKILFCMLLLALGAAAFGQKNTQTKRSISFKDEKGSLSIRNDTTADVVIFIGRVEGKIILGGIKGGSARSFDISKIPSIPPRGTFLIRAVNYETVKHNTFIMEDDVVYTGLVTYNLGDKNDMSRLIIPSIIDTERQFSIYVSNESVNYILELRIDSPQQGHVVAVLPPLQWNKRIYLSPRDDGRAYSFYPAFVYVNPKTGDKISINGNDYNRQRCIPQKIGEVGIPMIFSEPSKSNVKYDAAFVNLQNNTGCGVEFHNAKSILTNQKGIGFTIPGNTNVYEIQSSNGVEGQLYTALSLEFDDFTKKAIVPYKFKAGYVYDLIVTETNGTYQYDIHETGQKTLIGDMRIELLFE